MKGPTRYSDEDRVRLAERSLKGDTWLGPVEREVCSKHPTQVVSHRWEWPIGSSIESADGFVIESCSLCDEEEFDDVTP